MPATQDQIFWEQPEVEYIDGREHPKVSPKRTHSLVQAALVRVLSACAGDRGEVGPEWRFNIGAADGTHTELLPDVAFVSNERLANLRGELLEEPPFAPDVAVEVRSPSDNPAFVQQKMQRYLRAGAVLALDVQPALRRITAYSAGRVRVYEENERFEHPAAPWLTFDSGTIFPKPRP